MVVLVMAIVALAGIATLFGIIYFDRRTIIRRRVVVQLNDGDTALVGFLWARRLRHVHLKDVLVRGDGGDANVDGDVIVDRDQVLFVQLLES